jgi:hypothetical protein
MPKLWDGLSSPSLSSFPPPPGQPGKGVLQPPPWTAWKGWLKNPGPRNAHVGRAFEPFQRSRTYTSRVGFFFQSPGQPRKAVLQPAQESLQWLAYQPSALEHSCGTGFPARPCHPFPRPPRTAWKGCPTSPTRNSLETLSYSPHPGQPGKAVLHIEQLEAFMWDGLSSPSWPAFPPPPGQPRKAVLQPAQDSLERLSYNPPRTAWKGCPTTPTRNSLERLSHKTHRGKLGRAPGRPAPRKSPA